MPLLFKSAAAIAIWAVTLPASAAPNNIWNGSASPAQPYRYIESAPILRLTPQIANAETYASNVLFMHLYPSINPEHSLEVAPIAPSIASKTKDISPIWTRGNLSPSYVQELAYIDTYSNIRKYETYSFFPSIRMSLAMPHFGNGFGGSYPPLQFGFW